jgi:hypothetical protein
VQRAAINLVMVGDSQALHPTTLQNAPDFDVTASLPEYLKAEFTKDRQDLTSGENTQFRH